MCKGLDETGYQEAHSAFRTGHDSSAQQCHSGPEATATRRTPDQTKIKLGIITARMAHGMQHGAALLDTTNWPAGAWHTIRPQNWAKRHHIYTATTWHNSTKAAPLQQHSVWLRLITAFTYHIDGFRQERLLPVPERQRVGIALVGDVEILPAHNSPSKQCLWAQPGPLAKKCDARSHLTQAESRRVGWVTLEWCHCHDV